MVSLNKQNYGREGIQNRYTMKIYFRASFFLIYINDLVTKIKSKVKLITDNTSLFSIVSDLLERANTLSLEKSKT